MKIRELSGRKGNRHATVTLTYEEIRDMADGLCQICLDRPEYESVENKCRLLFEMVEHGKATPETIKRMGGTGQKKKRKKPPR